MISAPEPQKHTKTRRRNTERRYALIRSRVNEIYAKKVDGMRLDFDSVVSKVAEEFGFAEKTIRNILKG